MSARIARLFGWTDGVWTATSLWVAGRSPRERMLLCAMTFALAGGAVYQGAWRPLNEGRAAAREDVVRVEHALGAARARGLETGSAPAVDARAPARVVADTAAEFGLTIRRLSPENGRVSVALDGASFDSLIEWIAALHAEHAIRLASAEIERRPEPGTVSAQLVLER